MLSATALKSFCRKANVLPQKCGKNFYAYFSLQKWDTFEKFNFTAIITKLFHNNSIIPFRLDGYEMIITNFSTTRLLINYLLIGFLLRNYQLVSFKLRSCEKGFF